MPKASQPADSLPVSPPIEILAVALPEGTAASDLSFGHKMLDNLDDLDIPDATPCKDSGFVPSAAPCRQLNACNPTRARNTNGAATSVGALGPLQNARPLRQRTAAEQENTPPRGAKGGGFGGGIASTLAAARSELDQGMPRPVRLSRPLTNKPVSSTVLPPRSAKLYPPTESRNEPLGSIGRGPSAALVEMRAPGFEDDIDDETMAAEEAAFLARMKGKTAENTASRSSVPGVVLGACNKAVTAVTAAPVAPTVADAALTTHIPAAGPLAAGGLFDDFDDLSEEEL